MCVIIKLEYKRQQFLTWSHFKKNLIQRFFAIFHHFLSSLSFLKGGGGGVPSELSLRDMLIYDESGRELREFYYLSLLWRYDHLKVQPCYAFSSTFIIDQHNQTNSLSISKCRRRYILTNA